MATPDTDPQTVLREEILGDARRQAERILHHAGKEAEALLAKAKEEAERDRRDADAHTREEAARRREMILASVAVEAGRARAARVEELLRSVHDAAAQRLTAREGFDYREILVRLAGEAIRRMDGDAFQVEISGEDRRAFGDDLVEDIVRASGRSPVQVTLADGANAASRGLVIRDPDGRQVWDNGLLARLYRNWPVLRMAVAVKTGLVEKVQSDGGAA